MGQIASSVVGFVQGISVVKAFGGSGRAHRGFRAATDDFVGIYSRFVRGLSVIAAVRVAGRADRRCGPDHGRRAGSGRPAALPAARAATPCPLSLSVPEGQRLAIVGPSGAGRRCAVVRR
ncbi:hypothetical protein OIE66_33485 [Nonomuraea sp. NBC_01738]|uniref:hypothetical protein n=1 Tax=Nonomuraea sp. NBC_01738 TaxID=2976003 RepID=UPI002E0F3DFD|nr:hypothetical protein OIE66_33485 [Nonomuraea sp. NBC_01738]